MEGPSELWRIRKQFGLQIASCSFMTYVLCIGGRHPSRFLMSRATGEITMTESLPCMLHIYSGKVTILTAHLLQRSRIKPRYLLLPMSFLSV